ncbi:hypothetical protein Ahy_B05g077876 isoform A [Arachis hypogaea]|uniref:Uncharacterized protein n=1 Tax=Arachis hypogaea TaxID=3818 RepID=A0A444Z5S8_ARAHY|nr:hypothetical protein Ahy_B05g077876 isoform A [Arachis hypogaea]
MADIIRLNSSASTVKIDDKHLLARLAFPKIRKDVQLKVKDEYNSYRKEHLAAIGKSSGCQICGMIDPLQHNLRINFHGFLVLCLLLIVQKKFKRIMRAI